MAMKLLIIAIYHTALIGAVAQTGLRPQLIIIYTTNQFAPITVIHPSLDSWGYARPQSVITNLDLTCMTTKSVTTKIDGQSVSVVLHDTMVYGPSVRPAKYRGDQKVQRMFVTELSIGLLEDAKMQVNDEILTAERFSQKFKSIPETPSASVR
jgi:hypothetical protein